MQVIQYWSGYHPPAGLATSFYKNATVDELVPAADNEIEPGQAQGSSTARSRSRSGPTRPGSSSRIQRFPIVYSAKVADVGSLPNEKFAAIHARPAN